MLINLVYYGLTLVRQPLNNQKQNKQLLINTNSGHYLE